MLLFDVVGGVFKIEFGFVIDLVVVVYIELVVYVFGWYGVDYVGIKWFNGMCVVKIGFFDCDFGGFEWVWVG